jgi:hypothetical protein
MSQQYELVQRVGYEVAAEKIRPILSYIAEVLWQLFVLECRECCVQSECVILRGALIN